MGLATTTSATAESAQKEGEADGSYGAKRGCAYLRGGGRLGVVRGEWVGLEERAGCGAWRWDKGRVRVGVASVPVASYLRQKRGWRVVALRREAPNPEHDRFQVVVARWKLSTCIPAHS